MWLFVATLVAPLLIGMIAIALVFRWPPSASRAAFLTFALGLVSVPAAVLVFYCFEFFGTRIWSMRRLFLALELLVLIYPILLSLLLLVFVVVHGRAVRASAELRIDCDPRKWDLELQHQDLLSLMRRREWGFLVDAILPLGPLFVLGVVFAWSGIANRRPVDDFWLETVLATSLLACGVYWLFKDSFGGRSVGKWLTGLQVVDSGGGRPISFGQGAARNCLLLIPLFALVELAVASGRADRRRVGDLLAGTQVVMGPPNYVDGVLVLDPRKQKQETPEVVDPFSD